MGQNGKRLKNGSNASICSNIVQNGVKWFKMVLNSPQFYNILKNCQTFFKIVYKWSKLVQNDSTWSKLIQHFQDVTCHVSHVMCHMSHVICHIFLNSFSDKAVKLIGGGSVINGA